MRIEKNIDYLGFSVLLLKETRDPYKLHLNTNINYKMCLPEALLKSGWAIDPVQFGKGQPVWAHPLTGTLQSVLLKEVYSIIDALYTTQRKLELEKLRLEQELLYGPILDFEGD